LTSECELQPTTCRLTGYGGEQLTVKGTCLKKELESMEQSDVVTKVTEPTEWVDALVVVEKPGTGKLRVYLDPRDLNKATITLY
jgi:hypothetical protein